METISFKIQHEIVQKIDQALKPLNYNNRTEFLREAIRDKLNQVEKEQVIEQLAKYKGSLRGKSKMSEKEASGFAELEMAKKFGLKLD